MVQRVKTQQQFKKVFQNTQQCVRKYKSGLKQMQQCFRKLNCAQLWFFHVFRAEHLVFMICGNTERIRSCSLASIPSGLQSPPLGLSLTFVLGRCWEKFTIQTGNYMELSLGKQEVLIFILPCVLTLGGHRSTGIKLSKINLVHSQSLLSSPALSFCHTSSSAASAAPSETWCC